MNTVYLRAKRTVSEYVKLRTVEELSRSQSDNTETAKIGGQRLNALITAFNDIKCNDTFYRLEAIRELDELKSGICIPHTIGGNLVEQGAVNLKLSLTENEYGRLLTDLATVVYSKLTSANVDTTNVVAMLTANPWLVFCILITLSDCSAPENNYSDWMIS